MYNIQRSSSGNGSMASASIHAQKCKQHKPSPFFPLAFNDIDTKIKWLIQERKNEVSHTVAFRLVA